MTDGDCAHEFHERTKHHPESLGGRGLDFENKPRDHKVYRNLPTEPLADRVRPPQVPALAAIAAPDPDPEAPGARPEVDLETLTTLCYYAAGVTSTTEYKGQTTRFRAASCTGALYHVDLYPVVGEAGPVPAGVYHFDPVTVSLDRLREGDYRGVLAAATGDEERVRAAPVTFVAASEWWRNAWKYTERTFRHAFWDAGTELANLLAVARGLDRPARIVAGFADERVADLLGVDTAEEGPVALAPVGGGDPAPEPPAVEPIDPETEPLSADPKAYPLIHEAYRGSSLPDGEAAREWRERPTGGGVGLRGPCEGPRGPGEDQHEPGDGERVPLDPVGDAGASKAPLHAAIRRRRSCRAFEETPVNARKFATVLDRAIRPRTLELFEGDDPLVLNDCYLLVNAVEGLDPGTYQYHPREGALELLDERPVDSRRTAQRLALGQEWAGDAAANVYFLADLDAVVDRLGERGYRAAQLEAAIAMGRLYLATYAHRDLGGTGLTFFDDLVTECFAPRAAGQTPTCLYVLGRSVGHRSLS